ncbi:hypothetical protein Tco_0706536 [Tanacetum coccineum]|uniref:Uncharacterized protein n=1 Tax=Tanacetum coccineum TaxID=301880 RepID=A0ABQ4Y7T1_9ASTR
MSQNMKRVSFDDDDVKVRVNKHQTLVQDFIQLQKDTEVARNNLMAWKQKKLTLQAEVSRKIIQTPSRSRWSSLIFEAKTQSFQSDSKSSTPQEHGFAKPQPTQLRKSKKELLHPEKQATVRNLPPIDKKKAPRSIPSPEFDMLVGKSVHGVKQQSVQRVIANQRVILNGRKAYAFLDLSKKVDFLGSQNHMGPTQKPVIDLNMISLYHEEPQFTSIIDDDTFPNQKSSLTLPPPLSRLPYYSRQVISSVNEVSCFHGYYSELNKRMTVLWNPIIRKSVGIVVPSRSNEDFVIGFGFCSDTSDPKLVKGHVVWVRIRKTPTISPLEIVLTLRSKVSLILVTVRMMVSTAAAWSNNLDGTQVLVDRFIATKFSNKYRNLRIVLSVEDKLPYLEQPIPAMPVPPTRQVLPPDVLNTHTAWVKASKKIAGRAGTSSDRENLTRANKKKDNILILVSLRKEYDSFVKNYNMNCMGKTVTELHAMLKLHEQTLPPKDATPALHAIRAGRV